MEARAVGGRAALLLWSALCACDISSPASYPSSEPELRATVERAPEPAAASGSVEDAPPSAPRSSRVVLVTIDGVRWEDVFADGDPSKTTMPNLQRLVRDRGLAVGGPGCAHDMRASGPNFVSFPGYLEMFTGKPTSCTHNGCASVDVPTVVDHAREAAHREADVAVFASWGRYGSAVAKNRKALVLSAGAGTFETPPAAAKDDAKLRAWLQDGIVHSGFPGYGDYRPDVHTARIALRYLETKTPRLLVVGLGDADEYAHRGDIAGYRRAIHRADDFLDDLDRTLVRMDDAGRETAVVVTTDHGRSHSIQGHGARYPESQRVFAAAFGASVARRGVTCATEPLRLADVAGAVHTLLGLDGDADPGPLANEIVATATD